MPAILSAASFAGITVGQAAFPTVFNAQRWITSPLDKWYLYCAPHDTPGGIYFATAPALNGPWTVRNSGNALIATPAPYRHVSSPFVIRHPTTGLLHMYAHMLGPTGDDTQSTYLWTSTDGQTWTWANSQDPVIAVSAGGSGKIDTNDASYLRCMWDGRQFIGYYQGGPTVGGAHVVEAMSTDGITWTKTPGPAGDYKAWVDEAGVVSQAPCNTVLDGRMLVAYARGWSIGGGNRAFPPSSRWRDPDGTFSRSHYFPLQVGAPSTYDAGMVLMQDFAYEASKLWAFYSCNSSIADSNANDAVGSAYATVASNPLTYGDITGKS